MKFLSKGFLFFILMIPVFSPSAIAQKSIHFEVLSGPVYNFPSKLIIRQEGHDVYRMNARYISKPFKLPPYYDFRLSLWSKDSSAWGLKFTHHKLYLSNPNDVVKHFEITHGYNILSATRIWKRLGFTWNTALGVVIANPENTVRDKNFQGGGLFNDGYYLAGVVGETAIGRQLKITRNWYFSGEARLTVAWAKAKIADGYAEVPNVAIHFLVGTGYRLFTWKKP